MPPVSMAYDQEVGVGRGRGRVEGQVGRGRVEERVGRGRMEEGAPMEGRSTGGQRKRWRMG